MTAHARLTDPDTSHEAAQVARTSTARDAVLVILRDHGPMHDGALIEWHEAYAATGRVARKSPQRLRTARAELVREGRVRAARVGGKLVATRTDHGYSTTHWEAT